MTKAFTDTIFQPIKLYIEGVEVPFISISVSSGIGGLPTASITVPPQAGLIDIARFYSPKVHIFYTDLLNDYDDPKEADKLLFSGVIAQPSYTKHKDTSSSVGINFNCVHRYSLINDMLIEYTGWLQADPLNQNSSVGVMADTANSNATVITALAGVQNPATQKGTEITPTSTDGSTSIIPSRWQKYYTRWVGMPGVLINFWNQMKRSAYNRQLSQGSSYFTESFVKMYQPLIEDGLQFFERMAGHYPIEAMVQADQYRVDPCPETPGKKDKIVIPPSRQLFLSSSIQAEMTISNISSYLQNSGEVTTIYQIFSNFYDSIDYEIVTLASPAEIAMRADTPGLSTDEANDFTNLDQSTPTDTSAVDTLVKPRIPFYFSPTCNVLFPGMYSSINVAYDEINVPTRINLKNLEGPDGNNGFRTNFRSPHSIRQAIAMKVAGVNGVGGVDPTQPYSLLSTMGSHYGAIGIYEQGRGIKQETQHMPRWLSMFSHSTAGGNQPLTDTMPDKTQEQGRFEALQALATGWAKRYPGDQVKTLNPYSVLATDISAHHRMLFAASDYYYTQRFASSKAGMVECPFNPHIVPGYPMDILESNPLYPSFHAMCAQVTHNFTSSSASTSVQFVAAMTYSEMANYYIPMVSPMLQVALGLAENPTLVNPDQKAMITAQDFYQYTLGTSVVAPNDIMNFSTMLVKPKKWSKVNQWEDGSGISVPAVNGGELNPMLSYQGNMSLTYRNIESKDKIEERFGIKFIDMAPSNYGPTVMRYTDKALTDDQKFELGRSQFLSYDTYFGEPINVVNTQKVNNPSAVNGTAAPTPSINNPSAFVGQAQAAASSAASSVSGAVSSALGAATAPVLAAGAAASSAVTTTVNKITGSITSAKS